MRTVLFWSFITVLAVTISLTAYATIKAILESSTTQQHWDFVYFTWKGVIFEVVAFIISLATNLFGLRSPELVREVATKIAQDTVTNSSSDPIALNTGYWDTKNDFPLYFRSQSKSWLNVLEREFKAETIRESRLYPSLKGWSPSPKPPDLAPVELDP